jgi:Mg-chelatase subunit ChlD
MSLSEPFWLILLFPLVMSLWLWKPATRRLLVLRCVATAALLLAICGLKIVMPTRAGIVIVVADRSLSMPTDSAAQQKETIDLVHSAMSGGDKVGVVSFAESAAVEQSPQAGKFDGFTAEVGVDASHLADALDMALSLIDRERSGRILVLSDGQWTGRDVSASAARAAAAGVAVDYRSMQRSAAGDLAVERIQAPESVLPGESFMIGAWVYSPAGGPVTYRLLRGGQTVAEGSQTLRAGSNRLLFRSTAGDNGQTEYVLQVQGQGNDPVPGNNAARLLVGVRGDKPILCVVANKNSALPGLLAKGRLKVESRTAQQCKWTLEELAGYSAVILENVTAGSVGYTGMQNLAAWVAQSGGGLMLTGGRDSFGSGGYFKSPLDPILPVSMELRREHRKLSLAIVVALDRSGSMALPVPGGRAKIDLADLATAEVVNMLTPTDQFGCWAVDSIAHEIVPLRNVTDKAAMTSKILKIDSMGGGIFIYEALSNAARTISSAESGTRHIILFADADDSEEPGDYKTLVEKCVKAGITISVVGLGTDKDRDAELLKDIAKRAGGQCTFTNVAQELPRLFAQDTCVVSRSSFIDETTTVRSTGGAISITERPLRDFPQIGGYNLCYPREGVNVALLSEDEFKAPVLAVWQAGLGRSLCYAGEADGKFTGALAAWTGAGEFFSSLARWTAGKSQGLGSGAVATQELRNGVCRVELHLDPSRDSNPFSKAPELIVLSARPGEAAVGGKTRFVWSSPDTMLAEVPLRGGETVLATVDAPGVGKSTMSPVCLPYSPEYQPQKPGQGAAALEQLAKSTGGCERLNLTDIWRDVPRKPQNWPLAPHLLLLAAAIFLLEVFDRRTGLLGSAWKPFAWMWRGLSRRKLAIKVPAERAVSEKVLQGKPSAEQKQAARKLAAEKAKQQPDKPAEKQAPAKKAPNLEPETDSGINDALDQAHRRASRRTGR